MRLALFLLLGSFLLFVPAVTSAETITEDFEDLINDAGWTFGNLSDRIERSGGNPGAWFYNPDLFTFAPILRTEYYGQDFTGDYREMGVTTISLDAKTLHIDWGVWDGEMSILLRDTNGTPGEVEDDDYAYYVGPPAPLPDEGWVHYDFEIPSASTDSVPPGWSGGWVGDLEHFRPGVDWNDVITSVDRLEIWWLNPSYFAIIQGWAAGADNIRITMDGLVMPLVDIQCNGLDDMVVVDQGENVVLDIHFQGNDLTGDPADFWVIVGAPFGTYSYAPPGPNMGWWPFPPLQPLYTGPMPESGSMTVLDLPLPLGSYQGFFVLDTDADGELDRPPLVYDSVGFHVVPIVN